MSLKSSEIVLMEFSLRVRLLGVNGNAEHSVVGNGI